MKRGLMQWDRDLLPESELNNRQIALKAKMAARGLDLLAIFGDTYASEDVSYLSNLSFYWAKGFLLISAGKDPVIFTELSKRVHAWIHEVCPVNEVYSSRNLGADLGSYIRERYGAQNTGTEGAESAESAEGAESAESAEGTRGTEGARGTAGRSGKLGLSTLKHLPESIRLNLEKELPGWDLAEAGEILEELRLQPTPGEVERAEIAARMAVEAAGEVASKVKANEGLLTDHDVVSLVEKHCRISGAQDVAVKVGLAGTGGLALGAPRGHMPRLPLALDIKVQYLGCWARIGRIITEDGTLEKVPSVLSELWPLIRSGVTIGEARQYLCKRLGIETADDYLFILPGSVVPDNNYFGFEEYSRRILTAGSLIHLGFKLTRKKCSALDFGGERPFYWVNTAIVEWGGLRLLG